MENKMFRQVMTVISVIVAIPVGMVVVILDGVITAYQFVVIGVSDQVSTRKK
jgi:hypothetical protein